MTIKLKSITETSWLVLGDTEDLRIGLLTEILNEYTLMIKGEKKKFLNRKEVNKYFKEDIFNNIVEPEIVTEVKKDYFINGYPVDFPTPHEVLLKGNKLPLFSKKASSEVFYSAGWYCLHFPRNIMPSYCPKLSTLEAYTFDGPYKSELEMRTNLTRLRKEKNLKR